MADYIDRQTAIRAVMDLPNCPNGYSDTYDKACIIGLLEEVPSAQQCEYWDSESNHCALYRPSAQPIDAFEVFYPDDFCSHGERKDG